MKTLLRLALWTALCTWLLIYAGGLVRVSGAGLGCPDWPHCFGGWLPPASEAALLARLHELPTGHAAWQVDSSRYNVTLAWIEYLNRLLGVVTGLLIAATLGLAWRWRRAIPGALPLALASFLLVGFNGWLGARVVAAHLAPWLVSLHMGLALATLSLLVALVVRVQGAVEASESPARPPPANAGVGGLSLLLASLWLLTLLQVAFGAQLRGALVALLPPDAAPALTLSALQRVGGIKYLHLLLGLGLAGLSALTVVKLLTHPRRTEALWRTATQLLLGLTLVQVAMGFSFGLAGVRPLTQLLHLWLASFIVCLQLLLLLVLRLRQPPTDARGFRRVLLLMAVLTLGGAAFAGWVIAQAQASRQARGSEARAADGLPLYQTLPEFDLEDAHGGRFTRAQLSGQTWVVGFFFSTCPSICPMLMGRLAALYQESAAVPGLRFLAITTDPATDTAEVMRQYATSVGRNDERWRFLRGDLAAIQALAREGFAVTDQFPLHAPHLMLVDGQGQLRGYYNSLEADRLAALRVDLRRLLAAPPPVAPSPAVPPPPPPPPTPATP